MTKRCFLQASSVDQASPVGQAAENPRRKLEEECREQAERTNKKLCEYVRAGSGDWLSSQYIYRTT